VRHREGGKNQGAREKQTRKTSQAIECYGADSRGRAGERPGRVPEILAVSEVSAPFMMPAWTERRVLISVHSSVVVCVFFSLHFEVGRFGKFKSQ
jgi:hypothetical protein